LSLGQSDEEDVELAGLGNGGLEGVVQIDWRVGGLAYEVEVTVAVKYI